jgi:hypothetical protein
MCLMESVPTVSWDTLSVVCDRSCCQVQSEVVDWDECVSECEPLSLFHLLGMERSQSCGLTPMHIHCGSDKILQSVRMPTRVREVAMRAVTSFGDEEPVTDDSSHPEVIYRSLYWCDVSLGDIPAGVAWLESLVGMLAERNDYSVGMSAHALASA